MSVARFGTQKPLRPLKRTRAAASRRLALRRAADGRAAFRAAAVAFVRALPCDAVGGSLTLAEQLTALTNAVARREGDFGADDIAPYAKVPKAESTLWRWLAQAAAAEEQGGSAVAALADKPGRGRTRQLLPSAVLQEIERLAGLGALKVRRIVAKVQAFASDRGLPRPTSHKIRYALDDLGYPFHTTAAQGSQAALLDAVPHAAVPTDHPHQVWTGDTFQFPIPMRGYDPDADARGEDPYRAVSCEAVVFVDNHTMAVVSYYLCDPTSRAADADPDATGGPRGSRDDATATEKATAVEVLGALLSAALPDLALPATREIAGRLPSACLRLDVKCQQQLRGILTRIQLEVPELPGNYPPARGAVEEIVRQLKDRAAMLPGASPLYTAVTRSEAAAARARVRTASKKIRDRPTIAIAPRDLPDIGTLRAILDQVVHAYNTDPRPRSGENPQGWSPMQRLRASIRDTHGRPGTDALQLMAHGNVVVSKAGLVYRGVPFAASPTLFAPKPDGTPADGFLVGRPVEFRADPLFRGVFAFERHARIGELPVMYLPRLADAARAANAAEVAKGRKAIAHDASRRARAARRETAQMEIGLDAMHRAAQAGNMADERRHLEKGGVAAPKRRRKRASASKGKPGRASGAPQHASPRGKSAAEHAGTSASDAVAAARAPKSRTRAPGSPSGSTIAPSRRRPAGQMSLPLLPGLPDAAGTRATPADREVALIPAADAAGARRAAGMNRPTAEPAASEATMTARSTTPPSEPAVAKASPSPASPDAYRSSPATLRLALGASDPRQRVRRLSLVPPSPALSELGGVESVAAKPRTA